MEAAFDQLLTDFDLQGKFIIIIQHNLLILFARATFDILISSLFFSSTLLKVCATSVDSQTQAAF